MAGDEMKLVPCDAEVFTTGTNYHTVNAHEHRSVRVCPVCGQLPKEKLHTQNFVGYAYQNVMLCECGMIFADSGLTQFWYDEYYRERSKYADNGGETVYDDFRRHEHTATMISMFEGGANARILDFGCANGRLLKTLQEHGYENVCGFDPSSASTAKATAQGIKIVNTLACEQFDAIIVSHVLEHIYDLRSAMIEVTAALKENAILYVEVPDASRYRCDSPYQDFNIEHVNHFTLASLAQLAGRYGLVPLHVGVKTFRVGDGADYPSIFGVFRKAPRVDLTGYLRASANRLEAIDVYLNRELAGVYHVAIWGAGQLTLKLLALESLQGRQVTLVDGNPAIQGKRLSGRTVGSPEAIAAEDVIVVGSILNEKSILRSIAALKLPNRVVTLT